MTETLRRALLEALRRGDSIGYVAVIAESPLLLPLAADGTGRPVTVVLADGRRAVPAFTSLDGLRQGLAGGGAAPVGPVMLCDLAQRWPDPAWLLAIDPGLPTAAHLAGDELCDLLDDVFEPDNDAEEALVEARRAGAREHLLLALFGADLHVPVRPGSSASRELTDPAFGWWTEPIGPTAPGMGNVGVPVFTSQRRLRARLGLLGADVGSVSGGWAGVEGMEFVSGGWAGVEGMEFVSGGWAGVEGMEFVTVELFALVSAWPDESWTMAVNPGTPMAVTLPGPAVRALAASLDQASIDPWPLVDPGPGWWTGDGAPELLELQVAVPPSALTHYLRGGYDRVAGIVHLRPPRRVDIGSLYLHLGLARPGSPFALTDETLHIVRWRPDDGAAREWRADPAPRLASARVPAGTSLIRVALDGTERVVAYFDGRHWGSVP